MTRKKPLVLVLLVVLIFLLAAPLTAQSSYTQSGLNGALFDAHTAFNLDDIVQSFGGQLGYSIGGILDVGLNFSMTYDQIEGQDLQETNIGIKYGIMLLKQEELSPLSLELSGNYGYSFVDSDYYSNDTPEKQKEGQGYDIQLYLFRDYSTGNASAIRFGPFGGFKSYRYNVEAVSLAPEEEQEYQSERETNFIYGIDLTTVHKTTSGKTYYFSIKPSGDEELNLTATISTGLVFEIR